MKNIMTIFLISALAGLFSVHPDLVPAGIAGLLLLSGSGFAKPDKEERWYTFIRNHFRITHPSYMDKKALDSVSGIFWSDSDEGVRHVLRDKRMALPYRVRYGFRTNRHELMADLVNGIIDQLPEKLEKKAEVVQFLNEMALLSHFTGIGGKIDEPPFTKPRAMDFIVSRISEVPGMPAFRWMSIVLYFMIWPSSDGLPYLLHLYLECGRRLSVAKDRQERVLLDGVARHAVLAIFETAARCREAFSDPDTQRRNYRKYIKDCILTARVRGLIDEVLALWSDIRKYSDEYEALQNRPQKSNRIIESMKSVYRTYQDLKQKKAPLDLRLLRKVKRLNTILRELQKQLNRDTGQSGRESRLFTVPNFKSKLDTSLSLLRRAVRMQSTVPLERFVEVFERDVKTVWEQWMILDSFPFVFKAGEHVIDPSLKKWVSALGDILSKEKDHLEEPFRIFIPNEAPLGWTLCLLGQCFALSGREMPGHMVATWQRLDQLVEGMGWLLSNYPLRIDPKPGICAQDHPGQPFRLELETVQLPDGSVQRNLQLKDLSSPNAFPVPLDAFENPLYLIPLIYHEHLKQEMEMRVDQSGAGMERWLDTQLLIRRLILEYPDGPDEGLSRYLSSSSRHGSILSGRMLGVNLETGYDILSECVRSVHGLDSSEGDIDALIKKRFDEAITELNRTIRSRNAALDSQTDMNFHLIDNKSRKGESVDTETGKQLFEIIRRHLSAGVPMSEELYRERLQENAELVQKWNSTFPTAKIRDIIAASESQEIPDSGALTDRIHEAKALADRIIPFE